VFLANSGLGGQHIQREGERAREESYFLWEWIVWQSGEAWQCQKDSEWEGREYSNFGKFSQGIILKNDDIGNKEGRLRQGDGLFIG